MSSLVLTVAAVVGLAANIGVDLALRKGLGRSAHRGPHDRGSSALLALLGIVAVPGSIVFLLFGDPGASRLGLAGGVVFIVLLSGATWLRIVAMRELGESFSRTLVVTAEQSVVESGPYRWLRHPGYLAQLIVFTSLAALFTRSWIAAAVIFVLMTAGYSYRIRVEEEMLVAEMGRVYQDYQARTWRLVPGLY